MTRPTDRLAALNLPDPPALPLIEGWPYRIERRVLAGIPCLLELPPEGQAVWAVCLVYHGAWAAKEGKLGVYSALAARGVAVVIPDAPLHGERTAQTPAGLNAREYVWESVRRSVAEAPALLDALGALWGELPVWVVGSSMGGYVAQVLALSELRVARVAVLISSGVWHEPQVTIPELRAFLDTFRPITHAPRLTVKPFLLASGADDPVFPLTEHHQVTALAYRAAFAAAGRPEWWQESVFPRVGHYTSQAMRETTVSFLLTEH